MQILGVRLVGINAENAHKFLLTIGFLAVVWLLSRTLRLLARTLVRGRTGKRIEFWTKQAIQLTTAFLQVIGVLSIWFNDPSRLATFLGLFTAGLAFALQRVVTALAGYFVLLGGKTFNVGDRIKMGGVRGDVIGLGFIQTTIMEMGQPPAAQSEDPGMWVQARQYSGRMVTVTNDKIFDEPVYNYSRDFPFIWEEMRVGISYTADAQRAEQILLDVAGRYAVRAEELNPRQVEEMQNRYFMRPTELRPQVYWRMTDNWLELALRFLTHDSGVRETKDKMTREILKAFDSAGLQIASATYDIVGMPPIQVKLSPTEQIGNGRDKIRARQDSR